MNKNELESIVRDELVAMADADVGVVMETDGQNRGSRIDEINRIMGVPLGSPYCLSGQWVNLNKLCHAKGWRNPVPKTAGTQKLVSLESVKKWKRPSGSLGRKGDWAIFRSTDNPAHGHAVMVESDQKAHPHFETIEYNTNRLGSRDGQGTFFQRRITGKSGRLEFLCFIDVPSWVVSVNQTEK